MLKKLFSNNIFLFISKAFGLYLFWYLFYEQWLHPKGTLDDLVGENLVFFSNILLKALGFDIITNNHLSHDGIRVIGVDGTHGLWVGDPCNGLTLFALFTGFVLSYPGKWKDKIWFIPLGLMGIHIINIIRIVVLCLIVFYAPETLNFNHTYTFTIFVYAFVFMLWLIWAKRNQNSLPTSKITTG